MHLVQALSLLIVIGASSVPVRCQRGDDHPTERVHALLHDEKWAEAIALLDQVLARDPRSSHLFWLRAYAKGQLDDAEGAVVDASKAIELDPKNERAYIERGRQHHALKHYAAAIADFDRGIELAPDVALSHLFRGESRRGLGDLSGAIVDYTEAIRLDPDFPPAVQLRGLCHRSLGENEAARLDYVRATDLRPDDVYAWTSRAGSEVDCGRFEDALASAQKVVALSPDPAAALDLRGKIAWQAGKLEVAVTDLTRSAAVAASPGGAADTFSSLGCVQLCASKLDEAAAAFEQSAQRSDEDMAAWAQLMRWCARTRAVGIEPANVELQRALGEESANLPALQREVLSLCTSKSPTTSEPDVTGRPPHEACALLFFAACRAEATGAREQALRLFQLCVNTGHRPWRQWQIALSHLLAGSEAKALRAGLGIEVRETHDELAVVGLPRTSAAAMQGLRNDDTIVTVDNQPANEAMWRRDVAPRGPGSMLRLVVRHDGEERVLWVRVGFVLD
ncbi:MAG TPA: tetratricopeptide repeat protein [Planctomycetota bacterium]|nr:tetratricopeptide repeat protein [Planctomycetota bacterium]